MTATRKVKYSLYDLSKYLHNLSSFFDKERAQNPFMTRPKNGGKAWRQSCHFQNPNEKVRNLYLIFQIRSKFLSTFEFLFWSVKHEI